jgi:hypothetical protein
MTMKTLIAALAVIISAASCAGKAVVTSELLGISGDRAVVKRGVALVIYDISGASARELGSVSNWTAYVLGVKANALFLADPATNIQRMDLTTGSLRKIDQLFAPVRWLGLDGGEGALYVLAGNAMLIYHLSNGVIQMGGYPEPADALYLDGQGKTFGLLTSNRLRLVAASNQQDLRVVEIPGLR